MVRANAIIGFAQELTFENVRCVRHMRPSWWSTDSVKLASTSTVNPRSSFSVAREEEAAFEEKAARGQRSAPVVRARAEIGRGRVSCPDTARAHAVKSGKLL